VVNPVLIQALGGLIAQNDPVQQHRRSGAFDLTGVQHGNGDLSFTTSGCEVKSYRLMPCPERFAQHI
jgi:hypothetical protein